MNAGGHNLHINRVGDGNSIVFLESGWGENSVI
jgi:hypothetical protein